MLMTLEYIENFTQQLRREPPDWLDIDYRHLARETGVPSYIRVPTVGTHPLFIHGLANLVRAALWSTTS